MTDLAEQDDDAEVKPQQTADASAPPAAPAPPPGPSAFSQSQDTWKNPFESMATALPTPDYKRALANKQSVADQELRAVDAQAGRIAADNQRLGAAAEAKNAQLQAVDPNQMTTWNAAEKQKQYSTSPFEAFGSAAMIASLGMAAFTRAPMTASLNAMAGVMNGIKEGNDQAYDRDYASWKENNNVFQKRFDLMKSQLSSDMDIWKTKGAMGKEDLSNTLLKYGLYKQKALLDAGLDDVLTDSLTKQAHAVDLMSSASQKIEDQHALVEAVKGEQMRRQATGQKPMDGQEILQFRADAVRSATPEQREAQKTWREISNSEKYLKAGPEEKGTIFNDFWNAQKTGSNQSMIKDRYDTGVKEYLAAHPEVKTEEDIPFEAKNEIAQKAKAYKGESSKASAENDLRKTLTAEAIAKNGGQPLDAAQKKQIEDKVAQKPIPGGVRERLGERIELAKLTTKTIDDVERSLARHGFLAGIGGSIRRPMETLANKALLSDSTAATDFRQLISVLQQLEPRLLTGGPGGRPLKAEADLVSQIIPGLNGLDTVQNTVSRLRTFKSMIQNLEGGWTRMYEGNYNPTAPLAPPVMGGSPGQPTGKPLWMTGRPRE
jgi:hypothetical protein